MTVNNRTILLVEDNEDDVFLMTRALKKAGIINPMRVVEDGQQAIDYFMGVDIYSDRASFPYPDVVFLDLKLPYKSGFDVLKWLQEQTEIPKPTIFVLSSSNMPQDIERAQALGATSYLIKPPTPESLLGLSEKFNFSWQLGEKQQKQIPLGW